jgi:hypothetical protein
VVVETMIEILTCEIKVHLRPLRVLLADSLEESAEHLPKLPIAAVEWQETHGPAADRAD